MNKMEEYLKGYTDRLKSVPFDNEESENWRMGWFKADQILRNAK